MLFSQAYTGDVTKKKNHFFLQSILMVKFVLPLFFSGTSRTNQMSTDSEGDDQTHEE